MAVCPTAEKMDQPGWPAASTATRALYSYKYNWLIGGVESNAVVRAKPSTLARKSSRSGNWYPNPMKIIHHASETLEFICFPQLVAFQTDDQLDPDRGMSASTVKPSASQVVNGVTRQVFRRRGADAWKTRLITYISNLSDGSAALIGRD